MRKTAESFGSPLFFSVVAFAFSCWYGCLYGQLNLSKVPMLTGDVVTIKRN